MVPSKYKVSLRKKLKAELEGAVSCLSKENDYLKKTLNESHRHYSALNKLLERFLTLETVRLEGSQQLKAEDMKTALSSEQLSEMEENLIDGVSMKIRGIISNYSSEIEDLKNKLVSVSARCQYLEDNVAKNKGSTSDEQVSTDDVRKLQSNLKDALEKNKQWLEYDQQREAYVRAILDRMLWLEKQLNEANQACLQTHNEHHSDGNDQIRQMQAHYETLLQKAKDKLEVLRYELDRTSRNLIRTQNSCKEREGEVEELRQQLQTLELGAPEGPGCPENEEEQQRDKAEDLHSRLDEEKRKSANLELQADIRERFFKNGYQEDQKRIADLERRIKISAQDLEDERQDCLYLRKLMVKVLKTRKNTRGFPTRLSKREQQDHSPGKVVTPPSPPTSDSLQSSPYNSLQDESCLECPVCQTQYPAHQYRDLIYHLDVCHD